MLIILNSNSDKTERRVNADPVLAVILAEIERFIRLFDCRWQQLDVTHLGNAATGGETHVLPIGYGQG